MKFKDLNEIALGTLARYVQAAADDAYRRGRNAGAYTAMANAGGGYNVKFDAVADAETRKADQRQAGIKKAMRKIARVEESTGMPNIMLRKKTHELMIGAAMKRVSDQVPNSKDPNNHHTYGGDSVDGDFPHDALVEMGWKHSAVPGRRGMSYDKYDHPDGHSIEYRIMRHGDMKLHWAEVKYGDK